MKNSWQWVIVMGVCLSSCSDEFTNIVYKEENPTIELYAATVKGQPVLVSDGSDLEDYRVGEIDSTAYSVLLSYTSDSKSLQLSYTFNTAYWYKIKNSSGAKDSMVCVSASYSPDGGITTPVTKGIEFDLNLGRCYRAKITKNGLEIYKEADIENPLLTLTKAQAPAYVEGRYQPEGASSYPIKDSIAIQQLYFYPVKENWSTTSGKLGIPGNSLYNSPWGHYPTNAPFIPHGNIVGNFNYNRLTGEVVCRVDSIEITDTDIPQPLKDRMQSLKNTEIKGKFEWNDVHSGVPVLKITGGSFMKAINEEETLKFTYVW